jgi:hypothetical protein
MNPEDRIKAYLNQNKSTLQWATDINSVVGQVKLWVFYGGTAPPDDQIRKIVAQWAMFNAIGLLTPIGPTVPGGPASPTDPPPTSSQFVDSVKKVITTVGAGVTIGKEGANLKLQVTGATANLKTADGSASLGVSWGGSLKLNAEKGPFHFSGEIGADKWEISLTFPGDGSIPNLVTLPSVFKEGENAVRNIARAAAGFNNIDDVRKISAQIKPDMAKVQSAVDAVSGIGGAKTGMSFGFKLGSPDPMPGQQGMPPGVQGSFVVTWVF